MSLSTNTQYRSSENITIPTEATTISTQYLPFVSKSYLDTLLKEMFARFRLRFEKQQEELKQLR